MPFHSPKRRISDTENKLRVLFCLDAIGMATQEQLWPFVAQLELMEYLPFCMFVDELLHDGALAVGSHGHESVLYVTQAGKEQLALFAGKVVHADQERIRRFAPAYAAQLSARRQINAAYERTEGGWYRAVCTVREDDVPILLLRVATRDRRVADAAVDGFRSCAPQLLTLLYTVPCDPSTQNTPAALEQEDALREAASGRIALCAFGGRKHSAAVCLTDGENRYTMLLLLPDAAMAWGWAQAAHNAGERLAKKITAVLFSGMDERL